MKADGYTHYEVDLNPYAVAVRYVCGKWSAKHESTQAYWEVTCPKCLKAMGYEVNE